MDASELQRVLAEAQQKIQETSRRVKVAGRDLGSEAAARGREAAKDVANEVKKKAAEHGEDVAAAAAEGAKVLKDVPRERYIGLAGAVASTMLKKSPLGILGRPIVRWGLRHVEGAAAKHLGGDGNQGNLPMEASKFVAALVKSFRHHRQDKGDKGLAA